MTAEKPELVTQKPSHWPVAVGSPDVPMPSMDIGRDMSIEQPII